MKVQKTIVEKLLDQKKIAHQSYTYPADGFSDGVTVAGYINKPVEQVFKTLVTTGSKGIHLFVLTVRANLTQFILMIKLSQNLLTLKTLLFQVFMVKIRLVKSRLFQGVVAT